MAGHPRRRLVDEYLRSHRPEARGRRFERQESEVRLFYKKWANPGLFFLYLLVFFKQTLLFLQQINVKKCPSSKWHRDLNPRPLEHESSPMTTRPELPPNQVILFVLSLFKNGTSPASFCLFSVFTNKHYPFHNNIM